MATKQPEALVQVATRVPVTLLRAVKIWCVRHETSVMAFIADAVRDKLRRSSLRRV